MCLFLGKTNERSSRTIVYKLVCKRDEDENFFRNFFHSSTETHFFVGEKIFSNRRSVELTEDEKKTGKVIYGFHVFVEFDSVKDYLYMNENFHVLKCEVDPKDHVVDGDFYHQDAWSRSAVYMSLKPVEVIRSYLSH